mmetsp:Transcript_65516/g.207121  ORF Transcript_65516/g.207121 Transcript_65516/m.207121 type:complete len:222 (+) Transcript_65516:904-1569(+)
MAGEATAAPRTRRRALLARSGSGTHALELVRVGVTILAIAALSLPAVAEAQDPAASCTPKVSILDSTAGPSFTIRHDKLLQVYGHIIPPPLSCPGHTSAPEMSWTVRAAVEEGGSEDAWELDLAQDPSAARLAKTLELAVPPRSLPAGRPYVVTFTACVVRPPPITFAPPAFRRRRKYPRNISIAVQLRSLCLTPKAPLHPLGWGQRRQDSGNVRRRSDGG